MRCDLMILTASRPLSDLGYHGMYAAAIALVLMPEGQRAHTFHFRDCEIHIERTGKTGVIGGFAGEEFKAHYADETGTDVQAKFLANVQRLQLQAAATGSVN